MASRDTDLLTGSDEITEQLLGHVSYHMCGDVRKQFATGPLRLTDTQYDRIEENFPSNALRRNLQVRLFRVYSQ